MAWKPEEMARFAEDVTRKDNHCLYGYGCQRYQKRAGTAENVTIQAT